MKNLPQLPAILTAALLLFGCGPTADKPADIEYLTSPVMAGLDLPFPAAMRVNNMLYLSGNIGNIPGTLELAEGGIEGETRRALRLAPAVLR